MTSTFRSCDCAIDVIDILYVETSVGTTRKKQRRNKRRTDRAEGREKGQRQQRYRDLLHATFLVPYLTAAHSDSSFFDLRTARLYSMSFHFFRRSLHHHEHPQHRQSPSMSDSNARLPGLGTLHVIRRKL